MLEVPGKTAVDARDFVQQHIVKFDLRLEPGCCCARARQQVQLDVCFPDRAQRISEGTIKRRIGRITNLSHFSAPNLLNDERYYCTFVSGDPHVVRFKY